MTAKAFDFESYIAHQELINSAIKIEGGYLIIKIPGQVVENNYEIPLSSISSPSGIIEWTLHLSEKSWVSKRLLRRFIQVSCAYAGLKI
ncbi:hypothetical protein [Pluralibacter gergoviae]|uniref:hypothetical protein n=1 Tax=Pluralibacter gergoviae TaxID=61647 RepID=UPI000A6DD901|nr:hypothetical protein [Pluralibacter gergoviae]